MRTPPSVSPRFPPTTTDHPTITHPPPPQHNRELQFSKTWLVTLGDQDDIATRLKFRAGIDTGTWRSYARLGFRCGFFFQSVGMYVCVCVDTLADRPSSSPRC